MFDNSTTKKKQQFNTSHSALAEESGSPEIATVQDKPTFSRSSIQRSNHAYNPFGSSTRTAATLYRSWVWNLTPSLTARSFSQRRLSFAQLTLHPAIEANTNKPQWTDRLALSSCSKLIKHSECQFLPFFGGRLVPLVEKCPSQSTQQPTTRHFWQFRYPSTVLGLYLQ